MRAFNTSDPFHCPHALAKKNRSASPRRPSRAALTTVSPSLLRVAREWGQGINGRKSTVFRSRVFSAFRFRLCGAKGLERVNRGAPQRRENPTQSPRGDLEIEQRESGICQRPDRTPSQRDQPLTCKRKGRLRDDKTEPRCVLRPVSAAWFWTEPAGASTAGFQTNTVRCARAPRGRGRRRHRGRSRADPDRCPPGRPLA